MIILASIDLQSKEDRDRIEHLMKDSISDAHTVDRNFLDTFADSASISNMMIENPP